MGPALGGKNGKLLSCLMGFLIFPSREEVTPGKPPGGRVIHILANSFGCKNLERASKILLGEIIHNRNGEEDGLKWEELVTRQRLRYHYFGRGRYEQKLRKMLVKRHFLEEDTYGAIWEIKEG